MDLEVQDWVSVAAPEPRNHYYVSTSFTFNFGFVSRVHVTQNIPVWCPNSCTHYYVSTQALAVFRFKSGLVSNVHVYKTQHTLVWCPKCYFPIHTKGMHMHCYHFTHIKNLISDRVSGTTGESHWIMSEVHENLKPTIFDDNLSWNLMWMPLL